MSEHETKSMLGAQTHRGVTHHIVARLVQGQDGRGRSYVRRMHDVEVYYFEDDVQITASKQWLETIEEAQAIVRKYRERWER